MTKCPGCNRDVRVPNDIAIRKRGDRPGLYDSIADNQIRACCKRCRVI